MLNYQRKYWTDFASNASKDVLCKDLHASWDAQSQKYTSHCEIPEECLSILKANTPMKSVLDFGVGMGRNSEYLKSLYFKYKGYDTEPMVKNLLSLNILNPDSQSVTFNFAEIENSKFDLIYESVVMQHMPPEELLYILNKLSYVSPYLFSSTRVYNDFFRDFKRNTGGLNIALLRKALNCYEPVYSSIPIDRTESLNDETEYKILYKSKNFSS